MNEWKEAVTEQVILTCGGPTDWEDPIAMVRYLMDWNVMVALDPSVSEHAAALIEQGRREQSLKMAAVLCGAYVDSIQSDEDRRSDIEAAYLAGKEIADLRAERAESDALVSRCISVLATHGTEDALRILTDFNAKWTKD